MRLRLIKEISEQKDIYFTRCSNCNYYIKIIILFINIRIFYTLKLESEFIKDNNKKRNAKFLKIIHQ